MFGGLQTSIELWGKTGTVTLSAPRFGRRGVRKTDKSEGRQALQ